MRLASMLLLALASLVVVPSAHAARGTAIRWDQCYGDGGAANKNFACDTNVGSEALVVSFRPETTMTQVNGLEVTLTIVSAGSSLPAWWQFKNSGTCRQAALSTNFAISPTAVNCLDTFGGIAAGGIGSYQIGLGDQGFMANAARLTIAEAVSLADLAQIDAGHEYFAANIKITNVKTVGTGTCAGCVTPVCFLLRSVKVTEPVGVGDLELFDPMGPNSWAAAWQGGSPVLQYNPETHCGGSCVFQGWSLEACGLPTPARNQTWGAIKSLYR